ncbi:MAG: tRNA (adenosine(37)-N6)-threonylcarbamoyltransferase complex transferase subunit TsaD [Candidatus Omnitrophica bacterium]|nr:tRNA (adenosine(37)-N6)-threonylcarbamoyltransferase complex transferase subunit TsaD [Candidatus Omnitrophota bacterium]
MSLVLGIESSCDETSAAVVRGERRVLSNIVASSLAFHRRYGGVVPEAACRAHVEVIWPVVEQALAEAKVRLPELDAIAVTCGPGLVGALLVGVAFAKGLACALDKPLIGVSHLAAHLYAGVMAQRGPVFPCVGLIVSGGHTLLVEARDIDDFVRLGETRDDAAGEAFDKVAKLLGLGYPGGPLIERRALDGEASRVRLPSPGLDDETLDFSFSGLKTAVLYHVRGQPMHNGASVRTVNDVAASFQRVTVEALVRKAIAASLRVKARRLIVGGGVAANQALRQALTRAGRAAGVRVWFPPMALCIDNAAMIAGLGAALFRRGVRSPLSLSVDPGLGLAVQSGGGHRG